MRFVSGIEAHPVFSLAHRRRAPTPCGTFFSTPCRRLPTPGSWRSRTVLGAYHSLPGPYRSRSTLAPGRPRGSLDPSRSCSTFDPNRSRASLDANGSRSLLGPSRSRASLDLDQSRAALTPCPPLPALRRRVPVPRAGRHAVGGERDRGLVEGPLHHGSVGARGEGHDEGVGRAVAAQRRLGVQGRFDAVAVPMPQCSRAPPFLGAGEGEPGRPGSSLAEEQIRRGAPYDLRGSMAQQPSSALAPPDDHAVRTEGDRRNIG
ncbi:hypothetical protein OHB22_05600 [Streptomyces canus]